MLLPPELMRLVLQELVLSGSLVSALLASSYANDILEHDKEFIFCESVRQHIHPSVLLNAVAAVSPLAGDNEFFLHAREIEYDEDQCRASDASTKLTTVRLHMIEWYGKWQKAARLRVNSYLQ